MRIDENYSIENDSNQWVLEYTSKGDINPKTNKPTISTNKWYCSNLKQCLSRYLDESLKPADSIQTLIGLMSITDSKIEIYLNELKEL